MRNTRHMIEICRLANYRILQSKIYHTFWIEYPNHALELAKSEGQAKFRILQLVN